ncbi:hypothetical protein [Tamlana crocina]|uniref:Uncharacterized protein n=1 Tax=Tamlana crocina TaxID=393006 RepID=A0ABX1D845_9FLAO|nr:hypothetical protein [Tamlana crocina]NJX14501.1 hypothetical protein [Tamlana crocina]
MNIATVSLAIFILLAPAILARRIYFTKELSKSFTSKNTLRELFSSVFLAGLLHSIWVIVVQHCGYIIDFDIVFRLLFDARSIADYSNITRNIYKIISYFLSLTIIAIVISYLFRNLVRVNGWDRKYSFLRYDNNWYYLFSGEVWDIPAYSESEITSADIDQRVVDILVNTDNGQTIYRGNLVDYQLNKDNGVDYIVLSYPEKKKKGEELKLINSSYFVIPYQEIVNINLRYLITEEEHAKEND